eukprot:CAMPEP_0171308724 /NCGR_PEP_ID=MMETSP0816-20121228/18830_1 /TAXON_ID=420281 /ORGANISM="Proboscia inermis, Strain CCAP1064/1" /LENGTH=89 /DNA_ID=CAMNT_0011791781 /DNA_START=193 /DNA_END=461 /DNA_ORIENTATION=-
MTPFFTRRYELGLNQPWGGTSLVKRHRLPQPMPPDPVRELAIEERWTAKVAQQELKVALAALSISQFDYELTAPVDVEEEIEKMQDEVG